MNSKANRSIRPSIHNGPLSFLYALGDHLVELVISLENRRRREQMSIQIARIDTGTLHDAGISEAQRFVEINKPFEE